MEIRNVVTNRGFAIATLAAMLSMASAQADENQTKIDLQSASLLSFLDASADSQGRFGIIDRKAERSSMSMRGAMQRRARAAARTAFSVSRCSGVSMTPISSCGDKRRCTIIARAEYNPFNFSKDQKTRRRIASRSACDYGPITQLCRQIMEPPPFDAVAVAVLVSAPLETLCHVDKVGKSGLRHGRHLRICHRHGTSHRRAVWTGPPRP